MFDCGVGKGWKGDIIGRRGFDIPGASGIPSFSADEVAHVGPLHRV